MHVATLYAVHGKGVRGQVFFRKDDLLFLKKKLASSRGAPQENDAKFKFAIHPQGIGQFHDNYQIAKCQTVATLALV